MQGLQVERRLAGSSTWKYACNGTGSPDIFYKGISLCLECVQNFYKLATYADLS